LKTIYFLVFSLMIFGILHHTARFDYKKLLRNKYLLLICIGFTVRIVASILFKGIDSDLDNLKNIAISLASESTSKIYETVDFAIYPPLHLFILYAIGKLNVLVGLNFDSYVYGLIIKAPIIIMDIMVGVGIYRTAFKRTNNNSAFVLGLMYILNPVAILFSSIWGIYDSIFIFFILICLEKLSEINNKNISLTTLFFVLALSANPKGVVFFPIILFAYYEFFSDKKFDKKIKIDALKSILLVVLCVLAVFFLPFIKSLSVEKVMDSIKNMTMDFASVNAYNFFAFFRGNWVSTSEDFASLSFKTLSNIFGVITFISSFIFLFKIKNSSKYCVTSAYIAVMTFMFTVRMHEKHFFTAVIFLLIAYIYTRNRAFSLLYILFSSTILLNCFDAILLAVSNDYTSIDKSLYVLSFINLILTVLLIIYSVKQIKGNSQIPQVVLNIPPKLINIDFEKIEFEKSTIFPKFTKKDYVFMLSITIIYAIIAFVRLGDNYGAKNYASLLENQEIIVEFDKPIRISRIQYLIGPTRESGMNISLSQDGIEWTDKQFVKVDGAFVWAEKDLSHLDIKSYYFAKLENVYETNNSDFNGYMPYTTLVEVAFRDIENNIVGIKNYPEEFWAFFDEQDVVPDKFHYFNSSIFDEVYYNQTIMNFMMDDPIFETTHPHLGKYIMFLGVELFGFNPFGWRFSGTLVGVLMLPMLYILAKKIFKDSFYALFATIIFAFDFMHFVQTRLATIDTYPTIFIMIMFYFMYLYYNTNFYDTKLSKTLKYLFLSGLFMGIGIASKWTAAYGGVGLGVIFFYTLYKRYIEALKADYTYNLYNETFDAERDIITYQKSEIKTDTDFRKIKNYFKNISAARNKNVDISNNNLDECLAFVEKDKEHYSEFLTSNNLNIGKLTKTFWKNAIITCAFCVLFFVIIPLGIYILSFLPEYSIDQERLNYTNIEYGTAYQTIEEAENALEIPSLVSYTLFRQNNMFDFHSKLGDNHPYNAYWWEWIINLRPILYYIVGDETLKTTASISAFGNPAVWWGGIVAVLYCLSALTKNKKHNKDNLFLLIGYFAQLLPWTLVITRTTYIYHYFPCIIFLVLMLASFFKETFKNKKYAIGYVCVVLILFAMFYPILTGISVPKSYIENFLRWFPSWWFC